MPEGRDRIWCIGIGVVAAAVALIAARPYAGSWNDGSRLASVEAIVDHGGFAIDRSIFVEVPPLQPGRPSPYPIDDELLQKFGTRDKLYINGRYYSDKSPVPAYYLAAVYWSARQMGLPTAADRPDLFCTLMTLASSGLTYVLAVGCLFSISRRLGVELRASLMLTLSFAAGSVALAYAGYVNNHMMLLGVAMAAFRVLVVGGQDGWSAFRLLALGFWTGLAYTIDLGAGPPLCGLLLVYAFWKGTGWRRLLGIAAALPWLAFHHVVNYQIGGTLGPANAVPAYFDWPGSPFSQQNLTGGWRHPSVFKAVVYSLDMLVGKKGFLAHNLPLFLWLVSLPWLISRRCRERELMILGLLWSGATWLLYAATSNNLSGACCSIRWFVPLLAPGYVGLCVILRDRLELRPDALILGIGGLALAAGMAWRGPWFGRIMPGFWVIYPTTLTIWLAFAFRRWRRRRLTTLPAKVSPPP